MNLPVSLTTLLLLCLASASLGSADKLHSYRASPKLSGPAKIVHPDDPILNKLDEALMKISTVYMQALFAGTHTPDLDARMRGLEMELFDLLDSLYTEKRMNDYMKYESEVTRQMILYNMLKKLFGYTTEENESVQ